MNEVYIIIYKKNSSKGELNVTGSVRFPCNSLASGL